MTWFKVDDGFWGHPKQTALPPGAVALWVRAGSWSSDQLTDGRVPEHMVTMLGAKKRDAEQLVTAELWEKVDGGYQFHDWMTWQPSRDEVHAKRADEAERKRKWREKRAADKAATDAAGTPVPDVSHWDNDVASGGTDAGVPDLSRSSRPDPTRPDPTRSSPTEKSEPPRTSFGGRSHVSSARAEQPPLIPRRCPDHQYDVIPPKCGACADARIYAEAQEMAPRRLTVVSSPMKRCIVHDQSYTHLCSGCESDRKAAS